MLEARATVLTKRSIKKSSKLAGIDISIACMDLTTLEGKDSPGKVRSVCARAISPAPDVRSVAAVCVYPNLVPECLRALAGSTVKVASVATAFPSGLSPLDVKLRETRDVVAMGAHEIDMVIDRGALLAGRETEVFTEIVAVKEACGNAHLKVILETGELGSYVLVRRACEIALAAGADFIKTSTGKLPISTTPGVALLMSEAIRDHYRKTGRMVGLKLAGGIRTTKAALGYLSLVKETLGDEWLHPDLFRIGASALLDDLLMQREKELTGSYSGLAYVAQA